MPQRASLKVLSWNDGDEIARRFESLNCYDRSKVRGSIHVFPDVKPIEYRPDGENQPGTGEIWPQGHHYIARVLEKNIEKLSTKELARKAGLDRNIIRHVRRGERVYLKTLLKILKVASR